MKGVYYGLVPFFLSITHAAPGSTRVRPLLPRETIDHGSICERELTKAVWEENHYEDTMRLLLRIGPVGHAWEDGSTFDKSPLEVLKTSAGTVDEFQCTPKDASDAHCDSQDLGSKENCATTGDPVNLPQAVTLLKGIANFANFMVSVGTEAGKAADEVKSLQLELFEKFSTKADTDGIFGNNGPFVIAGAIAGAIPVVGGPLSGIFGIFVGGNSLSQQQDTTLQESMKLEAYVQAISTSLTEAFTNIADEAIKKPPGIEGKQAIQDYINNDPTALPALLAGGDFADSSSQSTSEETQEAVKQIVTSAAISSLLKANDVFVARVAATDNGWKDAIGKGDLCGDETDDIPFPSAIKWCEDGVMHILQRWNRDTEVKGYGNFGDYGLDIKDAAQNSWQFQKKFGINHKYEEGDLEYFSEMVTKDNVDLKRMQAWDLPVCDLEVTDSTKQTIQCPSNWSDAQCKLSAQLFFRCGTMEGWPYDKLPGDINDLLITQNSPP